MGMVVAGLSGALIAAGLVGIVWGLQPVPEPATRPVRRAVRPGWAARVRPRTWWLLAASVLAGLLGGVWTGWLVLVLVVPGVVVGLPWLLSPPPGVERIARLDAMAEWTRNLAGVLTIHAGLEEAILATVGSTPDPIRPEVTRLAARIRSRGHLDDALRGFADELDDATGDLVVCCLLLAARRRGPGLAAALEGLAEATGEDVRARREVEADRAKPRGSARLITVISLVMLGALALSGDYLAPLSGPVGQLILTALLVGYAAGLLLLRRMGASAPPPRLLDATAGTAVAS